ncbi:MAG: copper amine oxidase N-terminal domain-containing protein [Syntrophomonadaceae bacterium]|jgi:hypothetical protein|nr:copper amine oxidase N-terminal domain-containing protein [Syntrophomonadaceae bacterium]
MKRKISSIILALALCIGFAVPAFAATHLIEPEKDWGIMSIDNFTGETKETFFNIEGNTYEITIIHATAPATVTVLGDPDDILLTFDGGAAGDAGSTITRVKLPENKKGEDIEWLDDVPLATGVKIPAKELSPNSPDSYTFVKPGSTFVLDEGTYNIPSSYAGMQIFIIVTGNNTTPPAPSSAPILHATINITEDGSITASLTDVWAHYMEGNDGIQIYTTDGATVTFSRDLLLVDWSSGGGSAAPVTLSAGKAYNVKDIQDPFVIRKTDGDDPWFSLRSLNGGWLSGSYIRFIIADSDIGLGTGEAGGDFIGSISASAAPALTAKPTASTVLVNGKNIAFDAYNINGNNYFKLRDLAYTLNGTEKQFDVGWDGAKNAISLTSGKAYTVTGGEMADKGAGDKTPTPTSSKIYLNGKDVTFTAYNIEGNNYFKLRDIGAAFDFGVTWDGAKNTIVIDTSKGYTPE